MRLIRAKNYDDMSLKAANIIAAQVSLNPKSVLGLATGWLFTRLIKITCADVPRPHAERFFKWAQIVSGAGVALLHGAQDGQKFLGVLLLGLFLVNGQSSAENVMIPIWMMILCSVVMGLGTSIGGKKIIKSVGMDMVKLEKYQGFAADLSAALCILLSTVCGIPVSTTHVKTTAIMGVGAEKRASAINLKVVRDMVLAWVLTFPGCGVIGYGMAKLLIVWLG